MDRKSVIILVACMVTLGVVNYVVIPKYFPAPPPPPPSTNTVAQPSAGSNTSTPAANVPSAISAPVLKTVFDTNVTEQTIVFTNKDARYTYTSHGGGLKQVDLFDVTSLKKDHATNVIATLNTHAPAPVLAAMGDAHGDGIFSLTPVDGGARAEKTVANGLRVVKVFQASTNYLVTASVRLENTSSNTLVLPAQEWTMGMAAPVDLDEHADTVGLMWYDGSKKNEITGPWFDNRTLGCFPGTPRPEYSAGTSNIVWASSHNQFFALVSMPNESPLQVFSRPITLPRPPESQIPANRKKDPPAKGYVTSFAYPQVTLAPGAAMERQFIFYAGPKEYRTLARVGDRFRNNLDAVMGFGFFGFFSKALLLGMNWLHNSFHLSYGWAIIAITFIIKMLFWPLTAASTRSMKRMAALQPQMKLLQEKYKEDPVKMNKKMMEFWKENKVNPMGGCLPMVLQMPVFFGFFTMIRSAIELRGASWMWVKDLSKPDTLFIIPGLDFPFNLLPLVMGVTMLWQSHLTPPSPGMDPMQQKMMRYMPLMFLVFLYQYSSGLALYWTVNNLLSILQTKLTKSNQPIVPAVAAPATSPALTPASKKKK